MHCPEDATTLQETDSHGVKIHECPQCKGRWFDRDELRRAKDSADEDLRWLDFAPFVGATAKPEAGRGERLCPTDGNPMGVMSYEKSGVCLDECSKCHGVWLSQGEFEGIIKYLESEVNSETATQLELEAARQLGQVFTGHEGPLSEMRDLFSVLHLLRKRWAVEHPGLSETLDAISLGSPFK
jgi:Zn-finger nucleic acid-binding protein